jgi:hypothetical protein
VILNIVWNKKMIAWTKMNNRTGRFPGDYLRKPACYSFDEAKKQELERRN